MRKMIVKAFNSCKILIFLILPAIVAIFIFYAILKIKAGAADYTDVKEKVIKESVARPGIKYVLEDKERLADFPIDGYVEEYIPETAQEESLPELNIFIGDSRTVGIENLSLDDSVYIAKVGAGYEWFSQNALQRLDSTMVDNAGRDVNIVVALGVNDPDNAAGYVEKVGEIKSKYPFADVYFLSVNPVTGGSISEIDVTNFNHIVMESLPSSVTYLDSHSYLVSNGFNTVDGVHYTDSTYKKIHEYVTLYLG